MHGQHNVKFSRTLYRYTQKNGAVSLYSPFKPHHSFVYTLSYASYFHYLHVCTNSQQPTACSVFMRTLQMISRLRTYDLSLVSATCTHMQLGPKPALLFTHPSAPLQLWQLTGDTAWDLCFSQLWWWRHDTVHIGTQLPIFILYIPCILIMN